MMKNFTLCTVSSERLSLPAAFRGWAEFWLRNIFEYGSSDHLQVVFLIHSIYQAYLPIIKISYINIFVSIDIQIYIYGIYLHAYWTGYACMCSCILNIFSFTVLQQITPLTTLGPIETFHLIPSVTRRPDVREVSDVTWLHPKDAERRIL